MTYQERAISSIRALEPAPTASYNRWEMLAARCTAALVWALLAIAVAIESRSE